MAPVTQNTQMTQPAYNSYAPSTSDFEQQRTAVAAVNQSQFSQPIATAPDFSAYAPISGVDGLMDQSQKIKDAAQNFSQTSYSANN